MGPERGYRCYCPSPTQIKKQRDSQSAYDLQRLEPDLLECECVVVCVCVCVWVCVFVCGVVGVVLLVVWGGGGGGGGVCVLMHSTTHYWIWLRLKSLRVMD